MIKSILRVILLLIFLFYCPTILAGFWSSIGECVADPCNCGDSNSTQYEHWDGKIYNRGKKNHLCPPWNKNGRRHDNTCLVRAIDIDGGVAPALPEAFIVYYENLCAEEARESTYFMPKIRVRGQQCNAFTCWTTSNLLNFNGDCVTLAGGYALPLHRMCARIAWPQDEARGLAADPGYRKNKHLNYEGAEKDDKVIRNKDNTIIEIDSPKLCLYKDPSFFSTTDGIDLMDLDPNKQPYHNTKETHPVIKVIIFLVETASNIDQVPLELLSSLYTLMNDGQDDETTVNSIMKDLISFLSKVIGWIGNSIVGLLKEIGQINRVVDSKEYGCVNLPLGPLPPPYCEKVAPFFQVAVTSNICPKDSKGRFVQSTDNNPCVVSSVDNNFINNSIRVGYETLLPLCVNEQNPMITDTCVKIDNLDMFSNSASALHLSTAFTDIIKHCDDATKGAICIKTMWPNKCSITSNGCQNGFRIVYGEQLGTILTPKAYFNHDLRDCSKDSSTLCQVIWGVNMGEFIDISLPFPVIQTANDIAPLVKNFTLVDKNDRVTFFNSSIVRIPSYNKVYSFTQEPHQICVFTDNSVIGCHDRVKHSGVKVSDCSSSFNDINCISSYFSPQFIVSYDENKYSTSAFIEPASVYNLNSNTNSIINLAGTEFKSFVTNDAMITRPFSGISAPNPSSIFGKYQENILPFAAGVVNDAAVYISGLEYINGAYHLGGKYACLTSVNGKRCPDDIEMCVLANLLNNNIVKCSDLAKKSSEYGGLKVCIENKNDDCTIIDSIKKISNGQINIQNCQVQGKCYDGGVELCKISEDAIDRYDPSPSLGATLSTSQFYSSSASSVYKRAPTGISITYDPDKYGLRSKTSVELGLCTTIPQGICSEEKDYSESNGYAYWPKTALGDQATGTCKTGWHALKPLKRYCVPFSITKTFGFEPLYKVGTLEYTDVKCIKDKIEDK